MGTEFAEIRDFSKFRSYGCIKHNICNICALISQRYEISEVVGHTVVISREMVKSAKKTICNTGALNSRTYEISEILVHTVEISLKTIKLAKNTTCYTSYLIRVYIIVLYFSDG